MNRTHATPTPPRRWITPEPPPNTEVGPDDLERLDVLSDLLLTLNDPAASARQIAHDVERMPVLCARVGVRHRFRHGPQPSPSLAVQIATLGNRELEGILLQLLEDIVTLHCDRKEQAG